MVKRMEKMKTPPLGKCHLPTDTIPLVASFAKSGKYVVVCTASAEEAGFNIYRLADNVSDAITRGQRQVTKNEKSAQIKCLFASPVANLKVLPRELNIEKAKIQNTISRLKD